jgi:UDP-glucuronate 4-epimerase
VRVALTGAAGFIGAKVAAAFLEAGHQVIGVDRLRSGGDEARLHRAWSALRRNQNFEPVHTDLLDIDLVRTLREVDTVVNLAGRPGTHESWSDFPAYLRDNVECVDWLAQACTDANVTRLVHASSSSVYGRLAIGSEDAELAPISRYGVSKLAGDGTLRAHHAALGLPMVLLRFFSVYGPGQRPNMGVYRAIAAR